MSLPIITMNIIRKCTVFICPDSRSRGAGSWWSLGWRPGTRAGTSVRWWTGWRGPWPGSPGSSSWPRGTSSSASRRASYRETTPRQSGVRVRTEGTWDNVNMFQEISEARELNPTMSGTRHWINYWRAPLRRQTRMYWMGKICHGQLSNFPSAGERLTNTKQKNPNVYFSNSCGDTLAFSLEEC